MKRRNTQRRAPVFYLLAFAGTARELADKLAQFPLPPWRELLG